ncbi:helix-turn-helix domain-containing protein [Spirillospora sp. CA-294931]|uniref:helix-turn-helix domain-containing protein n=1 Tax=Spirillospora sp. CA-294931 TaxID=3240042 RepID=UPI003D8BB058
MTKPTTTMRARGLGSHLQELRSKRKLTLKQVATRLDWSMATLSRTENGLRTISPEDLGSLLVLYEVPAHERARLFALARDDDHPGWWETGEAVLPDQLVSLISFEAHATAITEVQVTLVSGLLQLPEYTRALLAGGGVPDNEIEARVSARLGRQALLSRPEPPKLLHIIDQAALHRQIGGAAVMAAQLRHLVRLGERDEITIQVIPFGAGAHAAINGSYIVLEFEKAPTIVHLEHTASSLFLDLPGDIGRYVDGVKALQDVALPPDRSLLMIEKVADQHERRGDHAHVPPVA